MIRAYLYLCLLVLAIVPVNIGRAQEAGGEELKRGLELYRAGNCDKAIPVFRSILNTSPKHATVRRLLASCLARQNQTEDARKEYTKVLAVAPRDADARRGLTAPPPAPARPAPVVAPAPPPTERAKAGGELTDAEQLIKAGRIDEAQRVLETLVERKPDLVLPKQRLAEIYTRNKDYQRAADLYITLESSSPEFILRAAQNMSWAENYPEAVRFYRQYLSRRPGDQEVELQVANVLLWQNKLDEAVLAFERYLQHRPADTDAQLSYGKALLWSKRYAEAATQLERVENRRSNDADVQLALAQAYEQSSNTEAALAAYKRVLTLRPQEPMAMEAQQRLSTDRLRQQGYRNVEGKDYDTAAKFFTAYLEKNPESVETMLQVARVLSWGKQYSESAHYYDEYLKRKPKDETAIRELARVELTIPDFGPAQKHFTYLAAQARATTEDLEGAVHAYSWDGRSDDAEPFARRLLELDKHNMVAADTLNELGEKRRLASIEKAQTLTASGRYGEAIQAYRNVEAKYGANRETQLEISRLYSWDKQFAASKTSYEEYLKRYPQDDAVRLELASVEKWSGQYQSAEIDYRAALLRDNKNPDALLGIAQIAEYKGSDPFRTVTAYQRVLEVDRSNATAIDRLQQLGPQVSPSISYSQKTFTDSDSFGKSMNRVEGAFPLNSYVKVIPFARYDYFNQLRQVGGADCGVKSNVTNARINALNSRICAADGHVDGMGGGTRLELKIAPAVTLIAEGGATRFNLNRSSFDAKGELQVRGGGDRLLTLGVQRRDAIYDVNTIASVFAGVKGEGANISYEQPLTERWRFWTTAGAGRYSRGLNDETGTTTQKRFAAKLDYRVLPGFTAGYYVRTTAFSAPSLLYFSPSFYGTGGITYSLNKEISPAVRIVADGEVGYGRIRRYDIAGVNTLEASVYPAIVWKIRPDLALQFGYRFSRGSTSAFGSPAYTTGSFDLSIQSSFMDQIRRSEGSRLDIR